MAHGVTQKKSGGARKYGRNKNKCAMYRMLHKHERSHVGRIEKHIKKIVKESFPDSTAILNIDWNKTRRFERRRFLKHVMYPKAIAWKQKQKDNVFQKRVRYLIKMEGGV